MTVVKVKNKCMYKIRVFLNKIIRKMNDIALYGISAKTLFVQNAKVRLQLVDIATDTGQLSLG